MWNSNDTEGEIEFGEKKGVTSWTIVCNWCVMEREGKVTGRVSRNGSGGNKPVLRDWLRSLLSNWFPAVETSSSLFSFPPSLRRKINGNVQFLLWPVFVLPSFLFLFSRNTFIFSRCSCPVLPGLYLRQELGAVRGFLCSASAWRSRSVCGSMLWDFLVSCQFEFLKNLTKQSYTEPPWLVNTCKGY